MSCFRACDIRGIYPAEVNEELFRRIGQAIARRWASNVEVLVGRDCRIGSPSLHSALIAGLLEGGASAALDAGRVPTPVVYYGKRAFGIPVAISVTASHNPPEYQGLKLLLPDGPAQPPDIAWLEANCGIDSPCDRTGPRRAIDLLPRYLDFLRCRCQAWGLDGIGSSLKVVADPGNGAWSGIAAPFLRSLGLRCSSINDEADGRFPARSPDCANPRNLAGLAQRVRSARAQMGLAWDGDGDRLAIIDDEGNPVSADQVALLLLSSLDANVGRSVLVDVKMSRVVRREILARGFHPVIERSAHCSLERTMRQQQCMFGCEYSGHYFFQELDGADDGLYAALQLCRAMAGADSLSEAARRLPQMFITPDIRVTASLGDYQTIVGRIEQSFPAAAVSRLDGVSVNLVDGCFLIRPSVSEDKLSLRAEGNSTESLRHMIRLVVDLFSEPLRTRVIEETHVSWPVANGP